VEVLHPASFKKPPDGGDDFHGCRDADAGWQWIDQNEQGSDRRVLRLGFEECANFPLKRGGVAGASTDLDEHGVSSGIDGVEVRLVSLECAKVVNHAPPAEQLDKDGGFESVSEVAPSEAFVDRDEARIDGIILAWVDHPPALRCREQ